MSAAIVRGGKILVVRRARAPANGLMTLPGGVVEVGETLMEAAIARAQEDQAGRVATPEECLTEDLAEHDGGRGCVGLGEQDLGTRGHDLLHLVEVRRLVRSHRDVRHHPAAELLVRGRDRLGEGLGSHVRIEEEAGGAVSHLPGVQGHGHTEL